MDSRSISTISKLEMPSPVLEYQRSECDFPTVHSTSSPQDDESFDAKLERLGRQRPEKFKSAWSEVFFVYSIVMSQVLTEYYVSGFNVILPKVVEHFNIDSKSSTWPANAFSLVVACFLLTFGRLSDKFGGYPVYVGGLCWLTAWSIIAGFAQNELMIIFCRALSGFGPSAYLPSSLMLLGSVYRPGPRKNFIFSIYGACAPLGFYAGIFFAGVSSQFLFWSWFFWIGAILTFSTATAAFFSIPSDKVERKHLGVKMDWPGSALISSGLILVVFSITDSGQAPNGWANPYIYITFILGSIILGVAAYYEGWIAANPLLPPDVFKVPYMKALVISLLFFYGCLGIILLYATLFMTHIMGGTPIQIVAWFTPMAAGGFILSTVGGLILHMIPGTILIVISGVAWIIAPLLLALMPVGGSYWAWVFPSMICATVGIDITFNVTNVFITTQLPLARQGFAGALINSLVHLAISTLLGFSDVIYAETQDAGFSILRSYRSVFWFNVTAAAVALILMILFVKIPKAKSELTVDEKEELKRGDMLARGASLAVAGATDSDENAATMGDEGHNQLHRPTTNTLRTSVVVAAVALASDVASQSDVKSLDSPYQPVLEPEKAVGRRSDDANDATLGFGIAR